MRKDIDLLQGSWNITALEVDGQRMAAATLAGAHIHIQNTRFTSTGMGAEYAGTLELDPSTSPRQLNMKFDTGPEKGNTNRGIYELDGVTWKLCLATRGDLRPSSFATTPGSGFALETLTRGDASVAAENTAVQASPPEQTSALATEFEGEWSMLSGIVNGQPLDPSAVPWVKRVTRGSQTTVYAGPQVMLKFEFTTDSSKSPQAIDYRNLAGPYQGETQYGIYEFEGDVLRVLVAPPGVTRPATFHVAPGETSSLTVWKRI